jgi:glycosyltransferase involved in cell wall biosynthesis
MSAPPGVRVVFVNHTAELGGGEIALLELVRHLDTARIQPVVVLFADGPLAPLLREKLREKAEVHILALSPTVLKAEKDRLGIQSLLRGAPVIAGLGFLYRLHRLLRSLKPEIVYTNSLKADLLGGIAGRVVRAPVVWHIRDRIAPDYLPRNVVSLFRLLARLVPTDIIANSAATLATLHLPAAPDAAGLSRRACVIHDGVDPAKYDPEPAREPTGQLTVGLIARISPWKGQDVFLEAVRLLHGAYPFARFEIVGAATFGEREFERRVRQMQQQPDLAHRVRFTGFEADIPKRLCQLDIVVHASTLAEPFGQVIIEGMAAGKPVIATNGGGVPEIVVDGVTGILVPMRDAQAMADAMRRLLGDAGLRKTMGAAARAHVQQNFSIQKTAKAVENVVEQIVTRRKVAIRHRKTAL